MEASSPEVVNTATATTAAVVKGKRTKRQRVQSPLPFSLTANSSSGDRDDNDGNDTAIDSSSPAFSQEVQQITTQEEEDMANCLILLAQGQCKEGDDSNNNNHNNNINNRVISAGFYNPIITYNSSGSKFNSRKFMETGSGKSGGYYVYECKTCNRTFPSFQALGGHRASHKKPKAISNNGGGDYQNYYYYNNKNKNKNLPITPSDEEDRHYYKDHHHISSLALQLTNNNNNSNISKAIYSNKGNKIHECSICGAEFSSGQALGGHMRRHRGPIGSNNSTALPLATMARIQSDERQQPKKERNLISLDLDLNLPAPEDEKLPFASKQQHPQAQQEQQPKPPLVFSSPALVGCQY